MIYKSQKKTKKSYQAHKHTQLIKCNVKKMFNEKVRKYCDQQIWNIYEQFMNFRCALIAF